MKETKLGIFKFCCAIMMRTKWYKCAPTKGFAFEPESPLYNSVRQMILKMDIYILI